MSDNDELLLELVFTVLCMPAACLINALAIAVGMYIALLFAPIRRAFARLFFKDDRVMNALYQEMKALRETRRP